jgi:hypothetical protein
MQARTAFGGARISRNVIAVFAAFLLLAFLIGGASGYLVKRMSLPVASQGLAAAPEAYALSDAATMSHRGGPQTAETQPLTGTAAGKPAPRHSGLQIP